MSRWNKSPFFFIVRVLEAAVSIYSLCSEPFIDFLTLFRSERLPLKESTSSAHVRTVRDEHNLSFQARHSQRYCFGIFSFSSSNLFFSSSVHFHGVSSLIRSVSIAEDSVNLLMWRL